MGIAGSVWSPGANAEIVVAKRDGVADGTGLIGNLRQIYANDGAESVFFDRKTCGESATRALTGGSWVPGQHNGVDINVEAGKPVRAQSGMIILLP